MPNLPTDPPKPPAPPAGNPKRRADSKRGPQPRLGAAYGEAVHQVFSGELEPRRDARPLTMEMIAPGGAVLATTSHGAPGRSTSAKALARRAALSGRVEFATESSESVGKPIILVAAPMTGAAGAGRAAVSVLTVGLEDRL